MNLDVLSPQRQMKETDEQVDDIVDSDFCGCTRAIGMRIPTYERAWKAANPKWPDKPPLGVERTRLGTPTHQRGHHRRSMTQDSSPAQHCPICNPYFECPSPHASHRPSRQHRRCATCDQQAVDGASGVELARWDQAIRTTGGISPDTMAVYKRSLRDSQPLPPAERWCGTEQPYGVMQRAPDVDDLKALPLPPFVKPVVSAADLPTRRKFCVTGRTSPETRVQLWRPGGGRD